MNMLDDRWSLLDCAVVLLSVPSIVLLCVLLTAENISAPAEAERAQVLVAASVLLVVAVVVCCYVARRIGMSCCAVPQADARTALLTPWHKGSQHMPPSSYDTFIKIDDPVTPKVTQGIEPQVHRSSASLERGCYQNLRPQADNG